LGQAAHVIQVSFSLTQVLLTHSAFGLTWFSVLHFGTLWRCTTEAVWSLRCGNEASMFVCNDYGVVHMQIL